MRVGRIQDKTRWTKALGEAATVGYHNKSPDQLSKEDMRSCSTGAVSGARSGVLLVAETRYFCSGSDRNVTIGARQLYFPGSAHPLFECGTISQRLSAGL
jgi:hypothetical protein